MEEIWKPIKGYEGLYEVSNLGKIKTLSRYIRNRKMPEKIKKLDKSKYGYLRVELSNNRIRRKYFVHRLVAEAFISNKNNLPCINHKDENKNNNIINIFESITEASKKTNIIQCEISNCLHNRQKTAGGYHWQYYKEEEKKDEEEK